MTCLKMRRFVITLGIITIRDHDHLSLKALLHFLINETQDQIGSRAPINLPQK